MLQTPDSDTTTEGIRIRAAARFREEDSRPEVPVFMYEYRISMTNVGGRRVKLLGRHWIIRDAFNEREDVRGAGVVGDYPVLEPGQSYSYSSSCPLQTRWGTMEGSYTFEDCDTGDPIDVRIGRFFLVPNRQPDEISAES